MDGGGISALKEHLVIWESLRALKDTTNSLICKKFVWNICKNFIFFISPHQWNYWECQNFLPNSKWRNIICFGKGHVIWQLSTISLQLKLNLSKFLPTALPLYYLKSYQKRIGLNGLLIHDYPTGLSRYSYELIRRILTKWEGKSVAYSASPDLNREFPDFNFYQCTSF